MSLLDDLPIMTIAFDNTPVSSSPIRWQMPRILGISAVLGLFSVVESFGLLLVGVTQVVAVLMCSFGWLIPQISWGPIGWVWAYNLAWMFRAGRVRLVTEQFASYRTARHTKSAALVNQSLQPLVARI